MKAADLLAQRRRGSKTSPKAELWVTCLAAFPEMSADYDIGREEPIMAINRNLRKPGEDNRPAGTYVETGPRGGRVADPRIVRIDRLPPTQKPGNRWERSK